MPGAKLGGVWRDRDLRGRRVGGVAASRLADETGVPVRSVMR